MFFNENGINPTVFPSLRKFENEIIATTAALLHITRAAVRMLPVKMISIHRLLQQKKERKMATEWS